MHSKKTAKKHRANARHNRSTSALAMRILVPSNILPSLNSPYFVTLCCVPLHALVAWELQLPWSRATVPQMHRRQTRLMNHKKRLVMNSPLVFLTLPHVSLLRLLNRSGCDSGVVGMQENRGSLFVLEARSILPDISPEDLAMYIRAPVAELLLQYQMLPRLLYNAMCEDSGQSLLSSYVLGYVLQSHTSTPAKPAKQKRTTCRFKVEAHRSLAEHEHNQARRHPPGGKRSCSTSARITYHPDQALSCSVVTVTYLYGHPQEPYPLL